MSAVTLQSQNSGLSKSLLRLQADECSVLPSFQETDFYLNMEDISLGVQIGQGAFSKVYVGKYLGELVAIKKQKRIMNDALEAYLMRELAVLKHFEHPNLLSYIGASDVQGSDSDNTSSIYIVTELAEHGDLLALLLGGHQLNWKLRVSILLDASRALEFLHSKNLIHRDIKSPNLLLDRNFTCKIADFGMAREIATNMTIVGTDAYMAPELMFDEPYNTSADMFSFGMVVWETIYKRKAGFNGFAERTPNEKFKLDCTKLADNVPEDTPASLSLLAQQLCEYDPDSRLLADDALLWLEDLFNELPNTPDERHLLVPIDYEKIFDTAPSASHPSDIKKSFITSGAMSTFDSVLSPLRGIPSSPARRSRTEGSKPPLGSSMGSSTAILALSPGTARKSNVIKAGYLHKKGKSGLRSWQKRWFVLEDTRLIWFKEAKDFPKDPRGFLQLRGCFIVRGLFFRWKILNADGAADQEDYNRQLAAKDAADMEQWISALESTMDAADVSERAVISRTLSSAAAKFEVDVGIRDERLISVSASHLEDRSAFYFDQGVSEWLSSINLPHLSKLFENAMYTDMLMIQELGLSSEDLDFIGVKNQNDRRLLKMREPGKIEKELTVKVSGFFNFGSELVYRLDSKWRFLRASTFFRYLDFDELHRKIKASIRDPKMAKLMPILPPKPSQNGVLVKLGNVDYAAQMARLQQSFHKYMQKLVVLIGTKEPYFTLLCSHLDIISHTEKNRLPVRPDEYLNKVAISLGNALGNGAGDSSPDPVPPRLSPSFGFLTRNSFNTGRL